LRKLEAELVALVIGEPAGHLGEDRLMIAKGAFVPRGFVVGGTREAQNLKEFRADFLNIRRIGTGCGGIAEIEAELSRIAHQIL
jgi:hypothetical protein